MASPRKISVILAADAVGYSRLSERDERGALAAVAWFRERAAEIVAAHDGRVFSRAGDGVMAELPTARSGVAAALELAEVVRARVANSDRPALPVRIGVHLGDVSHEGDGDRLGHDVNVAARIQQIAEPGEVLVSRGVADAAQGRMAARFERVGRERVKNLAEPIEVFRVLPGGAAGRRRLALPLGVAAAVAVLAIAGVAGFAWLDVNARRATATQGAAPPAPAFEVVEASIAVLPFADMSADGDQEYFADGLSEELMNQLAQIEGLLVTGRTSAFVYKDHNEDLRTIGATLGVAHILEGSVRKSGESLRITAQLINAADGYHLWSQTYDRDFGDIFAVQEDIARAVATALSEELGVGDLDAMIAEVRATNDPEAYDLLLRGEDLMRSGGGENALRAEALFREALTRDPDFMAAQAGLFNALLNAALYFPDRAVAKRAEADALIESAIANTPNMPNAWAIYFIRANQLLYVRGDLLGARRALDTAMELAPRSQRAQLETTLLMDMRFMTGGMTAVLEPMRSRQRADPLSLGASFGLQRALHAAGLTDEAEAEYRRSLDLQGDRAVVEGIAGMRAVVEGLDETIVAERSARAWAAAAPPLRAGGFNPAAHADDPEAALAGLRRDLARAPNPGALSPVAIAMWADHLGEIDLALEALETGYRLFGPSAVNPWEGTFKNVRGAPGFKDLMREYGYEAYWRETGEWGDFCRPLGDDDFECF